MPGPAIDIATIMAAVGRLGGHQDGRPAPCLTCRRREWTVLPDALAWRSVDQQERKPVVTGAESVLLVVVVVCTHCGRMECYRYDEVVQG